MHAKRDFLTSLDKTYRAYLVTTTLEPDGDTLLKFLGCEVDTAYNNDYPYSSKKGTGVADMTNDWIDFPDFGTDEISTLREKLWGKHVYDTALTFADKDYLETIGYLPDHFDLSFFKPHVLTDNDGRLQKYRILSISSAVDGLPPRALVIALKDSNVIDLTGDIREHLQEFVLTKYYGPYMGPYIPTNMVASVHKLSLDLPHPLAK